VKHLEHPNNSVLAISVDDKVPRQTIYLGATVGATIITKNNNIFKYQMITWLTW
jgi:hypothetical protein